jgi:uncharacterized protein YqeY
MLRETIQSALKSALKSGEAKKLGTLRLISAALKDKDIAARTKGGGEVISEDEILALLQTMIKQRQESIRLYREANRNELADEEEQEIAIIRGFLPEQMEHDAVIKAINDTIAEVGALSVKDMGKVMGVLKQRFTGQMDFAVASKTVKDVLLNQ